MYSSLRYTMAWSLMLAMIAAAGCGTASDKGAEADPENEQSSESGEGTSASTNDDQATGSGATNPPGKPRVLIETDLGKITVELEPKTEITVNNFLYYVEAGHYENTIFHEVMKGHVVIGGSFTADLREKPAEKSQIFSEARKGISNDRGTIAMSRVPHDKNSATCQFFFNLSDNGDMLDHKASATGETADQDYGYCAFGTVIEGMSVVDAIGNAKVGSRGGFEMIPDKDIVIRSMRVVR